ncbi:MAG: hypothetical protein ACRBFS_09105 [Aureispira sp.]
MNKFAPLIVGALVLLGLIAYFAQNQSDPQYWMEKYDTDGNKPYDARVLYDLLEHRFDLQVMENRIDETLTLDQEEASKTSYLYLSSQEPRYTEDEAWHLRDYVRSGGEVFIIAPNIPDSLAELLLYPEDCGGKTSWQGKSNPGLYRPQVLSALLHPNMTKSYYSFNYMNMNYIENRAWNYIPEAAFCDTRGEDDYADYGTRNVREYALAKLGTFKATDNTGDNKDKEFANFVRMKVGEGYFYFHTNPIMFTNMYLIDSVGFEYSNYVFRHIKDRTVYWDRQSIVLPSKREAGRKVLPKVAAQSPLEYIFAQPSLRWGWYMALALGFIYVLFGAKRRQRIIPIMETNRNTSLEFIETIGRLYFQQQDHRSIIKKQMHLFLAHMRQRYHLVTKDMDERLIDRIAVRARVDRKIINDIFVEYNRLHAMMQRPNTEVTAQMLNNFYLLIERFHTAANEYQVANTVQA